MTSGDLFGLHSSARKITTDAGLLVYPAPLPLPDMMLPSHSWQGDMVVRRWIVSDPFHVAGVRQYRSGDTMKSVNWKATARYGHMMVHKYDTTSDHRLVILLNMQVSESMWKAVTDPDLVEKGISFASTLAGYAARNGIPVGFGTNGYTLDKPKEPVKTEIRGGSAQLEFLLETMAKLVTECCCSFDDLLEAENADNKRKPPADYLIITPYVCEKIDRQIQQLRRSGNAVELLHLRHEAAAGEQEAVS
jgi:uncharacterized protein (DUF58 family)